MRKGHNNPSIAIVEFQKGNILILMMMMMMKK